jgi:CHAT domain-containing protein/CBASS immunity sensor of nucleotide second messenger signals
MTTNIVLWLDLAADNQMSEGVVREHTPDGAEILRLTKYVEPFGEGTPPAWPQVLDAIDRLVREARWRAGNSGSCRYWVTGRAALPAFCYLGHRLSQIAAITFLHQPDDAERPVPLPIAAPRPAYAPPCFQVEHATLHDLDPRGPTVLAVSCPRRPSEVKIRDALAERQTRPSGIVSAHFPEWFDEAAARSAARQLFDLVREIADAHPDRSALAVVLRGPTPLAFLVGRSLNSRVCRDVQVYQYDGSCYSIAYELPYPVVPSRNKVIVMAASPADLPRLDLEEEAQEIQREQQRIAAQALEFIHRPSARPYDIYVALDDHRPGVLHISGHGQTGELMFQDDHGLPRQLPTSELAETIRLVGRDLRLVVLSACHSESHVSAVLEHVDCVIAMRGPIRDDDARRFAATLYRRLAHGDSVRDAFDHARHVMRLQRPGQPGDPRPRDVEIASGGPADGEPPQLCESDPHRARNVFLVQRCTAPAAPVPAPRR